MILKLPSNLGDSVIPGRCIAAEHLQTGCLQTDGKLALIKPNFSIASVARLGTRAYGET